MPQAIIPIFMYAAGYIGVGEMVALIALSVFSQMIMQRNMDPMRMSSGTLEEYSGTVEPRRIVYGEVVVSGMNAIPPWLSDQFTVGSVVVINNHLEQCLVVAGHEVQSITDVYLNQTLIADAAIPSPGSPTYGEVTTGDYAHIVTIRRYTGASTDTVDPHLTSVFATSWDSSHIGKGMGKVFLTYKYTESTIVSGGNPAAAWNGGKPDVRVRVRGKKCYDPRLDTTPGANPTNAAYIAWTFNPALCIIDYLMDATLGVGETAARIDWTMAVAAANACDELVAIPGSTTQKRYACNASLDCTAKWEENLQGLAGSMQGAVLYSGGLWRMYAGKYAAPTFTITDADVVGSLQARTAVPYADRYNAVRGQFYDPTLFNQPNEYPPQRVTADETADGEGPIYRELNQPTCTNTYEAQRNAMILQRKSRRKKMWTIPVNYGLFGVRPGEFGSLTITELSLSGQVVRCTGWKFNPKDATLNMVVEEVNSADWNDPATVTYSTTSAGIMPAQPGFTSGPCTTLTATGAAGGITLAWTLPTTWFSSLVVDLYEATSNNIASATVVWSGVNTGAFLQKSSTTTYYYWVKVRNTANGSASASYPAGATSGVSAAASSIVGPPGSNGSNGTNGTSALVAVPTKAVVILPCDAAGNVLSFAQATGDIVVYLGTTDVSASSTFALETGGNPDGLTYSINASTGVWAITACPVDNTTLTFRATYSGAPLDVTISIVKQKAGAIDWTPNVSGVAQTSPGSFQKTAATTSWDSQVYSSESYPQCFVSLRVDNSALRMMFGLNTDPTTDASYSSIDHAMYHNGGTLNIYEGGASITTVGSFANGDTLALTYDGFTVRWLKNGVVLYAKQDPGKRFYLDSSFYDQFTSVANLSFGPMTSSVPDGKNMLDAGGWVIGTTGTQGNYIDGGSGTASTIVLGGVGGEPVGPYGTPEPLWKGYGNGGTNGGGGWNDTADIKGVDPTKTYRSSVWFYLPSAVASGGWYHGADASATADVTTGAANSNPYFVGGLSLATLTPGRWYLSVGFVQGSGYGTTQMNTGGVYDGATGTKIYGCADFKQLAGYTYQTHRAFQYYAPVGAIVYLSRPRFELVDGTEPSILSMLGIAGTAQLAPSAATSPSSAIDTSTVAMGTSPQTKTHLQVSVNIPAGETWPVAIDAAMSAAAGGSGVSGQTRLYRDATILLRNGHSEAANGAFSSAFTYTETLTAGTYIYGLVSINTSGGASSNSCSLTVKLLKR